VTGRPDPYALVRHVVFALVVANVTVLIVEKAFA
jgi:hypothetical protein